MTQTCRHCGAEIQLIRYALGEKWMHVTPGASFPTAVKGTAWWHCQLKVAEP